MCSEAFGGGTESSDTSDGSIVVSWSQVANVMFPWECKEAHIVSQALVT